MDELIGTFIRSHYPEELVEEIYKSFGLFGLFNYGDAFQSFDGILGMEEADDSDQVCDLFIATLHQNLDYLLEQHTLRLTDETTLEQKNEILRGLYMIQHLADYTPLALTLESESTPEEKVARIIEDVTSYDEATIMSLVESYRDSFLDRLKLFVYEREAEMVSNQDTTSVGNVNRNLKVYQKLFGDSEFTEVLLESELLPAQDFKDYLPFLKDELVTDSLEESVKRIYWLLLMSSDGTETPLQIFREHSQELFPNLDMVTRAEQMLLNFIGRFEELKKVMYEKA